MAAEVYEISHICFAFINNVTLDQSVNS